MSREQLRTLFDPSKAYVVSTDGVLPSLSGRNLTDIRTASVSIEFWSANIVGVLQWNAAMTEATVTHSLNCLPVIHVYDSDGKLISPDITILSSSSFKIIFEESMNSISSEHPYILSIVYGSEYGDGSSVTGEMPSAETMARTWAEGTDSAVQDLGGTHSAKGWVEVLSGYMSQAAALNAALQEYDGDTTAF